MYYSRTWISLLLLVPVVSCWQSRVVSAHEEKTTDEDYLPVVLWHGMGDSCCHPRGIGSIKAQIEAAYPGIFVYSVATGKTEEEDVMSTYFGNANAQVEQVCAELSSLPQLRGRPFIGVGFSQGGLLLRSLIQRCTGPTAPKAHTLITMGSPHDGVSGLPGCWISRGNRKRTAMGLGNPRQQLVYQPAAAELDYGWCEAMRDLLGQGAYYSWLQENIIQAQYFKDPFHLDWYLASSGFLADVNNDREAFNASYADALRTLRRLVLYQFENDITVVPRQSAHFGFYNGSTVIPLNETVGYLEDRLGLRTLDETGRLTLATCPGFHMQFTLAWFEENVTRRYLGVRKEDAKMSDV